MELNFGKNTSLPPTQDAWAADKRRYCNQETMLASIELPSNEVAAEIKEELEAVASQLILDDFLELPPPVEFDDEAPM